MTADGTRSGLEIRARLAERLNEAVLRPGMFGGEPVLMLLVEELAWIDRREGELDSVNRWLTARGASSSTGVRGAFALMFGGALHEHEQGMTLVYADLAHRFGYLAPERVLTGAEYGRLRREAGRWAESTDRVMADLIAEFGTPSLWRPAYNRRWPVSVGYVSDRPSDPMVAFDFWQVQSREEHGPPFGPEPVLRDVRWLEEGAGRASFRAGFTFAPAGRLMLAPPEDEDGE